LLEQVYGFLVAGSELAIAAAAGPAFAGAAELMP